MTETTQRTGLTTAEARQRQQQYGKNELTPQKKENFLKKILHVLREPMFLLLLLAAAIYFVLGEPRDGAIMLVFVVGIITIDVVQEWKTDQTPSRTCRPPVLRFSGMERSRRSPAPTWCRGIS